VWAFKKRDRSLQRVKGRERGGGLEEGTIFTQIGLVARRRHLGVQVHNLAAAAKLPGAAAVARRRLREAAAHRRRARLGHAKEVEAAVTLHPHCSDPPRDGSSVPDLAGDGGSVADLAASGAGNAIRRWEKMVAPVMRFGGGSRRRRRWCLPAVAAAAAGVGGGGGASRRLRQ